MRVGLVGFGYWGKIIFTNLSSLVDEIIIVDSKVIDDRIKYTDYKRLLEENISHVFIVTPVSNHFECVEFFLKNKINVFCEKPLTLEINTTNYLYEMAKENKINLFVDWIFTFNKAVNYIDYLIRNLNLKPINIVMNRLNKGPVRYDTDAKSDLSSHDLSIISYLFPSENLLNVEILDFKRNLKSVQNDSSIIILNFEKFNVQINSSWEYGHKDRICTFEFDKGLLIWDDNSMGLDVRFEIGDLTQFSFFVSHFLYDSPLKDSLHTFLNTNNFDYEKQKKITLDVITNLQKNYENTI